MATFNLGKLYQGGQELLLRSTDIYDVATKQSLASYIASNNAAIAGLEAAIAGKAPVTIVTDINARDAQSNVITGTLTWVQNATSDPTVGSGAAAYLAMVDPGTNAVTWTKIAEAESMDIVFDWANIQNKPTSTAANIDDAVAKKHAHDNKTVLDGISADASTSNLVYNGVELGGFTGTAVGATLADATDYTTKMQIVVEAYDPDASV